MKREIIEKLGLKETDKSYGVSAIYNVVVYLFQDGVYCVAADKAGYPDQNRIVTFFKDNQCVRMTEEFIIDSPLDYLRKILAFKP